MFREHYGRVTAWLIGQLGGDFLLAEDCIQEALLVALETWPHKGLPRNKAAWIATTAKRKAIDVCRRRQSLRKKTKLMEQATPKAFEENFLGEDSSMPDERLKLIFTCCHPALSSEAQVALTLRTVAGLHTTEIAKAFLVSEKTMAQRLVRCQKKIKKAGIPYRVPPPHLLEGRVSSVLSVLYLIFNEGYEASFGRELLRSELCREGIRLSRLLRHLLPQEAEIRGLLALMLLQDSRRRARVDSDNKLVTLEFQNRELWDQEQIDEGEKHLDLALTLNCPGPYQIQAAIACLHCRAETAETTDWNQIAALYHRLYQYSPTPVVALNRAVAVAMSEGPDLGLKLLEPLNQDKKIQQYRWFHAARADLLRRAGRLVEALPAYSQALELTENKVEREYIEDRISEIG